MAGLAQAGAGPILRPVMPHEILAPNEGVVVFTQAPCGTGVELRALDALANFVRLVEVGSRKSWTIGNFCDGMQAYLVAGMAVRASEIAQATQEAFATAGPAVPGRGVGIFQPMAAGEVHQPTVADLVSQLIESKTLAERAEGLRAQRKLSFKALLVYREWGKNTQGLMRILADVLETFMPAALEALARQVGATGADILASLRGGAGSGLSAAPAILANPWVVVAALAVVAGIAWVTVPLAIDALKTVGTQAIQSICLAQILSASERGVNVSEILRAMPDICQPPSWLTWLYVGGAAAVVGGAGYWWYRRRRRAA